MSSNACLYLMTYKMQHTYPAVESSGEQSNLRLSKRNSGGNLAWVYLEVCRFCKKGSII